MSGDLLFVYGTLRADSTAPMQAYLASHACCLGAAWCTGRLYDLGAYPGFVPVRHAAPVRGDLYRLRGGARVWRVLDAHEGIGPGFAPPREYRRRRLIVTTARGEPLPAWTYVYNRRTRGLPRIPGGDYLAIRACGTAAR